MPIRSLAALALAFAVAGCGDSLKEADAPPTDARTGATAADDSLAGRLEAKKAAGMAKAPDEVKALMKRAGEELSRSGLVAKALNVGDKAPAFTLKDAMGQDADLEAMLAQGPVVVTFYRGKW